MPAPLLVHCPYCDRWYAVDTTRWPAQPADTVVTPEAGSEAGEAGAAPVSVWVPVVVTVTAAAGAVGVLVWHRDAGAVLAAMVFAASIAASWWWWGRSRRDER